jgi:hypothetical protein
LRFCKAHDDLLSSFKAFMMGVGNHDKTYLLTPMIE